MDSKNKTITEISSVVENLSLKIVSLQAKVDQLCRSTGNCELIKKAHKDLIPKKEDDSGTNIDALCKEE